MTRPNNHNAREILARSIRSPSEIGLPWTPLQCFEAIGGPAFLEFIPERARRAYGQQEQ